MGSQRGTDGRCSGPSSARGTEPGLRRCQRHLGPVITARLPACTVTELGWQESLETHESLICAQELVAGRWQASQPRKPWARAGASLVVTFATGARMQSASEARQTPADLAVDCGNR